MRVLFFLLFVACILTSCSAGSSNKAGTVDVESLQKELEMLKSENLKKDSLVTESITYFNEIERNLASIELKEKEIKNEFGELKGQEKSSKALILEKINYINKLRLENGRKMYALQKKLDTIDVAENEFKELLKRVQTEIRQKDKEISKLQKTLEEKDREYGQLFADYKNQLKINQSQEEANNKIREDMKMVHYALGTQKELKSWGIINVTKKKFSTRKIALNNNFEETHFNLDAMDALKEISMYAKKMVLITDHPEASYQIVNEGNQVILKITNPQLFWKVTRYLVIMVE